MVQVHYVPCLWVGSAICSRTAERSVGITRYFEQAVADHFITAG
jgi:hypothetical protein